MIILPLLCVHLLAAPDLSAVAKLVPQLADQQPQALASDGKHLFIGIGGQVYRLDPLTGELKSLSSKWAASSPLAISKLYVDGTLNALLVDRGSGFSAYDLDGNPLADVPAATGANQLTALSDANRLRDLAAAQGGMLMGAAGDRDAAIFAYWSDKLLIWSLKDSQQIGPILKKKMQGGIYSVALTARFFYAGGTALLTIRRSDRELKRWRWRTPELDQIVALQVAGDQLYAVLHSGNKNRLYAVPLKTFEN